MIARILKANPNSILYFCSPSVYLQAPGIVKLSAVSSTQLLHAQVHPVCILREILSAIWDELVERALPLPSAEKGQTIMGALLKNVILLISLVQLTASTCKYSAPVMLAQIISIIRDNIP